MVMRETGSVSFWTEPSNKRAGEGQVTYFFPAERAAYARRRKVQKRQRTQRLAATALIAIAATLGFVAGRAGASGEKRPTPPARWITVGQGDTLWTIAKRHGDRSTPILERIDALTATNPSASDGLLTPGQRLRLPAGP